MDPTIITEGTYLHSMNTRERARMARVLIHEHLTAVELIGIKAVSDDNYALARQRLYRWRERVIGTLRQHVDAHEADQFSKLRKSLFFPGEPLRSLSDEIQMFQTFLEALDEELEHNPGEVFGPNARTSKQRTPGSPSLRKAGKQHEIRFDSLHPAILAKCRGLYESEQYPEAVEKGFKIVRDRLRALSGFETGGDAFGKGKLHIKGAAARNVDEDFNSAVKFLTMAIDNFRNEKSHTSDARIEDPNRAYEYLTLSSLALNLLEDAEVVTTK